MNSEEKQNKKKINLVDILLLIKHDKRQMLIYVGIAAVLGLVAAFTTPRTYKCSVMLAPEESGSGFSGSISSLASMVGMNMRIGQTGDALYPEIYPDLVSSTDFIVKLFPITVTTKDQKLSCDYYTYLTKHRKTALFDYPKVGFTWLMRKLRPAEQQPASGKGDGPKTPLWLTRAQAEVVLDMSSAIVCSVDKKTSVITLSVTDQDPLIAATVADSVKAHLQVAITDYRTKKARVDLEYMQKLFNEARQQYDKARQLYASYADANQDVLLQTYKMKQDDLENDMQLKYNIYTTLVEQLQLAKAKVQERTPAFTEVQSATVPVKPSSRGKAATLLIWMMLGFVVRSVVLLWKNRAQFLNA